MKYYDGQPDEQPTGKVTGGTGENIEIYSGTDKQITEQMFARINELQAQNSKLTKQVQLAREGMQEAIDRAYKYDIGKNAARILKQTLKQMDAIDCCLDVLGSFKITLKQNAPQPEQGGSDE